MSDINNSYITGADLYLLVAQIFAEYVNLGQDGQQPYEDRVAERQVKRASDLTDTEREELARLRPIPTERKYTPRFSSTWLRTCYSHESDAACRELLSNWNFDDHDDTLVLNDPLLYDFGKEWHRIFRRIPQLVSGGAPNAQIYSERKQSALQETWEIEEKVRVNVGGDPERLAALWDQLSVYYQWACIINTLLVIDEITLSSGEESRDQRTIFVVWFDDCGREIRSTRVPFNEAVTYSGIMWEPFVMDHGIWANASLGEDYRRDAVAGTTVQGT